jgi:lysophospholipase L1-like esterase
VVWIGDSWIQIPGTQHTTVRDDARAAGDLGANQDFVDLAVSGSPIATIVNQYTTQEAGSVKVKLLLMDGGGIDTIEGGGSQASVQHVVTTFTQFLTQVKNDGTVQAVVYFLYPPLSTIAGVDALRPGMSQVCASSPVPCFFLDLGPLFAGHPEYIGPDGIHPNATGGTVIGNALWNIIQTNNLMQLK